MKKIKKQKYISEKKVIGFSFKNMNIKFNDELLVDDIEEFRELIRRNYCREINLNYREKNKNKK